MLACLLLSSLPHSLVGIFIVTCLQEFNLSSIDWNCGSNGKGIFLQAHDDFLLMNQYWFFIVVSSRHHRQFHHHRVPFIIGFHT